VINISILVVVMRCLRGCHDYAKVREFVTGQNARDFNGFKPAQRLGSLLLSGSSF